eukprot:CAMPEP_0114652748 /NCGR_PEP_ID=MMETSP0191-20121206/9246_1 /TAXON_ID=126664 /ORGANISM="Sorites sp." /LENGTH=111 /DNA_ID=CAMNT_0001867457 /DNA_START=33 /DNA_END=368 /DNA_ORIENTATION=-
MAPGFNWIGKLQELCQKKMKRNLEKQEITFNTESHGSAGNPSFQSTVFSELFVSPVMGEPSGSKKQAEHAAARAAIEQEFPEFVEDPEGHVEPKKKRVRKKGNGKGSEYSG